MAIFEIMDDNGKVINSIIAEPDFVESHYKGLYQDITPEPKLLPAAVPVKTLEEKVDKLIVKVDALINIGKVI